MTSERETAIKSWAVAAMLVANDIRPIRVEQDGRETYFIFPQLAAVSAVLRQYSKIKAQLQALVDEYEHDRRGNR
jgi:type IV secretory pathway VirB9-like protein